MMINEIIQILRNATICLPALEIILLITILTVCLTSSYSKVGLIAACLFTYKWGFQLFIREGDRYLTMYVICGSLVCILTVIGMIQTRAR